LNVFSFQITANQAFDNTRCITPKHVTS